MRIRDGVRPFLSAEERLAALLPGLRRRGVPVFYTRFELAPDGSDIGVYGRKRPLLETISPAGPMSGWPPAAT